MSESHALDQVPFREQTIVFQDEQRGVLVAEGSDTATFLNRLLTYSIDGLEENRGCRPFLLNARGRIIAVFACLRVGPNRFLLEAEEAQLHTIQESLNMFHFAEDFRLSSDGVDQCSLCGSDVIHFLESLGLKLPQASWETTECTLQDRCVTVLRRPDRGLPYYTLFFEPADRAPILGLLEKAGAVAGAPEGADVYRIRGKHPCWPNEFNEKYTPLDVAGMDGMTDGKGCYPGQEVIERTIAIGRPAHGLVSVKSAGELSIGDRLYWEDAEAGTITSAAQESDGQWVALATIKNRHLKREEWTTEHGSVTPREAS